MKQSVLLLLIVFFGKYASCQDSSFYFLTNRISALKDYKHLPNHLKTSIGIVLENGVEFEWQNKPENAIGSVESCNTFINNPSSYQKVQQLKRLKYLSYSSSNGLISTDCDNLDKYISYLPFPDSIIYLEYHISTDNDTFATNIEKLTKLKVFNLDYYSWPSRNYGFSLRKCNVNQNLNYLTLRSDSHKYIDTSLYNYTNISSITIYSDSLDSIPDGISQLVNLYELMFFPNSGYSGGLKYLPNDIGKLKKLELLNICSSNLKKLPDNFRLLDGLKYFGMEYCFSMTSFPTQIFSLKGIKTISCDPTLIELLTRTNSQYNNINLTEVVIWPYYNQQKKRLEKINFIKRAKYKKIIHRHFPNAKTTFVKTIF